MDRNILKHLLSKRTVRIKYGNTFSVLDILNGHILKEGRLPDTRLTDYVHMTSAVATFYTKLDALVARICFSEIGDVFGIVGNGHVCIV